MEAHAFDRGNAEVQSFPVSCEGRTRECRYLRNDFTRELTELCRKHKVKIFAGILYPMEVEPTCVWRGDLAAEYHLALHPEEEHELILSQDLKPDDWRPA